MLKSRYPIAWRSIIVLKRPYFIVREMDINFAFALRFGNLFMACIDNQLQSQSDVLLRDFIKDQVRKFILLSSEERQIGRIQR